MQTVIIAGGKGTRLGITDIPKPMLKIGSKPVLQYQVELAKKYFSDEIFIISGYLSDVITDFFNEKNFSKIHHIKEPFPLGTAGSLKLLEGKLKSRFLVLYGDIMMNMNLENLVKFDNMHSNSMGTAVVHVNNHPYDSDLIFADSNNKITKILSKPHKNLLSEQYLANSGIYIFSAEIFKYIDKDMPQDIGKDILTKVINDKNNLYAYITDEYIKDIGTVERLEKVRQDFISGRIL